MTRELRNATVTLILVLASAAPLLAQDKDGFVARTAAAEHLAELVARCGGAGFSGSVLAARDGKVLVACGVGHADGAGKVPNTANTLFELASATKQFTAAAILALVEKKRLQLDDPISRHLPDIPKSCKEITVRQLLQHTSGIPGSNSQGGGDDLERVIPLFLRGGPRHAPGSHWEYWNQGYALLSAIIERSSQQSYAEFCKQRLFAQAKMRTACFTGDDAPRGASVAIGRSKRGDRSALEHPYGSYGYQYRGMGGAVSNVWDLWRWDRALHGTKLLRKKSKQELFTPGLENYALGWRVQTRGGRRVHSHGGGVRGFVCDVRRYPDQDACLFILCNRDDFPLHGMSALLEGALFGNQVTPPPPPVPAALRKAAAGRYRGPRGVILLLKPEGELTWASIFWNPSGKGPVTRALVGAGTKKDTLVLYEWSTSTLMHLAHDDSGRVSRITISGRSYTRSG